MFFVFLVQVLWESCFPTGQGFVAKGDFEHDFV